VWPKKVQGFILSAYFYGYLLIQAFIFQIFSRFEFFFLLKYNKTIKQFQFQLPAGLLALKFGGRFVLSMCILIASIFSLLLPFAARVDYTLALICRFLIGLSHV
jgi:nitrate/nitrite transporter NarK